MQHEVTNGQDPICNMKLPMVGTLYVTRDPICNGTLPTLLNNPASLGCTTILLYRHLTSYRLAEAKIHFSSCVVLNGDFTNVTFI